MTPSEAEARLQAVPEYAWILANSNQWYSAVEVAKQLGVSSDVVSKWCRERRIPGAVQMERRIGWRLPRSGILVFLAELQDRAN